MQITQKLKEAKEEGIQIRADCQAMIKQYQVKFFIFDCYVSPGPFDRASGRVREKMENSAENFAK